MTWPTPSVSRRLALTGGVLAVVIAIEVTVGICGGACTDVTSSWIIGLTFALFPVSVGVAIVRESLVDVDVVIARSLTFAVLAAFITGVYALVVVGIGSQLGQRGEPDLWLSVATTALVAVVFEPLRTRVHALANRLVFGRRATPYEVMSTLTARLSEVAPQEQALERLARLLVDGTGARRVSVWLRVRDELRLAGVAPDGLTGDVPGVVLEEETAPPLPGDASAEVRHAGELLGVLVIDKVRGDTVTPSDERLLGDAAAGAGLLLRTLRLNAELETRAEELRRSRRRVVASHDVARRRLERDLHDGAQQEVVALKVKLGLARTVAEREDAADLVPTLEELAGDTQSIVESMRAIARGIYPPLLEAEGLQAAVSAAARLTGLPVEVEAGVPRLEAEVEASVYFTALEAIRNAAQHSAATRVQVSLSHAGGHLHLSVQDDGDGFDVRTTEHGTGLTHARDRVAALGGELEVSSAPGAGTRVQAIVPAAARAEEGVPA